MPPPRQPGLRPRIAAIADDVTGATDVAAAFRQAGLGVRLVFGVPDASARAEDDIVVIALRTRTVDPSIAVHQALASLAWAQAQGFERFYFKYCSTFDSSPAGNIGPVADALADRLGAQLTVIAPATPVHGRTVYEAQLFVWDQLLSESPMRDHPLTPMTDANLVRLLGHQTTRAIAHLHYGIVAQGAAAITEALTRLRESGARYVVVDGIDDEDLCQLGRSVAGEVLTTGAAGLATGLATALIQQGGRDSAAPQQPAVSADYRHAAVLAGSCSARTLDQVARMVRTNPAYQLDPVTVPGPDALAEDALRWFDSVDTAAGGAPLIYSSMPAARLRVVQKALGVAGAATVVEAAMGLIGRGLVERGIDRLVVAGGETSGSVTEALGIRDVVVGADAAPGVPWLFADVGHPLALLLKSGNFGEPGLLVAASATSSGDEKAGNEH